MNRNLTLILGERQRDRQRALLGRLESAYDRTTRDLSALLLVPTPRRAHALREAVLEHFSRKCWMPNVETVESLIHRHAADLSVEIRLIAGEARLLLIQELLAGSRIVRVPNARTARRIADVLDGIAGADMNETRHPTEIIFERFPEFAHLAQRIATLYHQYRETLRTRRLMDGTRLAIELARRWKSGGFEGASQMLVLDEFVSPEPLDLGVVEAIQPSFGETVATVAGNPANATANARGANAGDAALAGYAEWLGKQSPEILSVESPAPWNLPQQVSKSLFGAVAEDLATESGPETTFRVLAPTNRRAEARTIARLIRQRLGQTPKAALEFQRFAVVVPKWEDYQGLIAETFEEYGIPAHFARGIPLSSVPAMRLVHKVLRSLTDVSDGWTMETLFDTLSTARMVKPDDLTDSMSELLGKSYPLAVSGYPSSAANHPSPDASPSADDSLTLSLPDSLTSPPADSPSLLPFDIGRFDALVRQAGVADVFHPARWFRRLSNFLRYRANYDPDDESAHFDETLYRKTEQVAYDLSVIGHFVRRVQDVEKRSEPAGFRDGLLSLILDYGLVRTTRAPAADDADAEREFCAWNAFLELLDEMVTTFESPPLFGAQGEKSGAREFAEYLSQALNDPECVCHPPQPENAVCVLALHQTVGLSFDDLFILGVLEGDLPRVKSEDFFLVSTGDDSVNAESQANRLLARERFLFREVLTNADRVVLSAPRRHEGKDLSPSPFLEDVRALFGIYDDSEIAPLTLQETAPILSAREALIRMGVQRDGTGAERLSLPDENVAELLAMEQARQSAAGWSSYDGYLGVSNARIADILAERVERGHSVTQLDDYAACPMAYFFRRVLRLRPVESLEAEIAPNIRGIAVHDILDSFFNQVGALVGRENFGFEEARRAMRRVAVSGLSRYDAQYPNLYWEEEKRALLSGLEDDSEPRGILFALLEAEYSGALDVLEKGFQRGKYSEIEFGEPNPSKPHFGRAIPPVRLLRLDGDGDILIHGRIDRVDLDPSSGRYVVYDYKLGWHPPASGALRGLKFQLAVYLEAVSGLEECREGVAAAFYSLKDPKKVKPVGYLGDRDAVHLEKSKARSKGLLPSEHFVQFQGFVRENIREMDAHIRAGRFQITLHDAQTAGCGRCEYRGICRVNFSRQKGMTTEQPHYSPADFGQGILANES